MKILVVSQYFYPEQFRINDVCFELVKRGHDVTVLTGLPNYPSGEIYSGYEQKGNTSEIINGVRVVRCKLRPRHKGTINLIRNYFSFVRQANKLIKCLDKDFEVVYVYGVSPITQALPAIKYKNKYKVPVFYYCMDLWPEAVLGEQNGHKQIGKKNPIFFFANKITKYIYERVDRIGVKCLLFKKYISSFLNIDETKIELLYEHAETLYLSVAETPFDNGIIDFVFLGNIGRIQNCEQIADAFSLLKDKKQAHLHFVGDGSDILNVKKKVIDLNLNSYVSFYGHCPIDEVLKFYNLADVCVLTMSNKTLTGKTIPGKFLSYMAASRPIIASIDGETATIIKETNCGYVCEADNINGLASLFQKVLDNQPNLLEMGKNGRSFFESTFIIDVFVNHLITIFQKLINNEKRATK